MPSTTRVAQRRGAVRPHADEVASNDPLVETADGDAPAAVAGDDIVADDDVVIGPEKDESRCHCWARRSGR